ncbi:MAG TPA: sigma-70 family RNA polymerase sigma factor [Polyangiaceae bacterium]|nr:sigma-70 family RNA polymerase sigma factor [Polyangiaceae bacterium]
MLRVVRTTHAEATLSAKAEDDYLALVEAARSGDVVALRTLLSSLAPHILRVVRRVVGAGHPDVEDIAQECAVELVHALRVFRGESSVQHFASRVALRASMNARRRHRAAKRAQPEATCIEADDAPGYTPTPDALADSRACVELARELCDELPEPQAEVLALHCVLGHTMAEVAVICDAPLETVRSRLRAAKASLVLRALEDPRLREYVEETA